MHATNSLQAIFSSHKGRAGNEIGGGGGYVFMGGLHVGEGEVNATIFSIW